MLDAERAHAMAADGAEPGERRRMTVEYGDDPAMGRTIGHELFDMRARVHEPALARALRRGPAGVEPVGRGDGKQADVAAVLGHQPDRLDRLRHHRPGIGDDDLAIGTGRAPPIRALHEPPPPPPPPPPLYLPDRPRRTGALDPTPRARAPPTSPPGLPPPP